MESKQEYRCEACGQTFETRSELERHVHTTGLVD
jgi:DNA-directed RNA polymerase subunit RPC12/RpoP